MKIQDFDFNIDVLKSLLWRHNDAINLQALLQYKQNALDELNQDFWESWVNDVFNLQTANEFGLTIWSIILNLPISIGDSEAFNFNWGFGQFRKNFDNGRFVAPDGVASLTIEEARAMLKLRYYQLVTRATVSECNKIMADVFDTDQIYVLDGYDMTISYVFLEQPSLAVKSFLETYDLLPRPSGVKLETIYNPNFNFGFGQYRKNFDNGRYKD